MPFWRDSLQYSSINKDFGLEIICIIIVKARTYIQCKQGILLEVYLKTSWCLDFCYKASTNQQELNLGWHTPVTWQQANKNHYPTLAVRIICLTHIAAVNSNADPLWFYFMTSCLRKSGKVPKPNWHQLFEPERPGSAMKARVSKIWGQTTAQVSKLYKRLGSESEGSFPRLRFPKYGQLATH